VPNSLSEFILGGIVDEPFPVPPPTLHRRMV
jgi:hypothetical protein